MAQITMEQYKKILRMWFTDRSRIVDYHLGRGYSKRLLREVDGVGFTYERVLRWKQIAQRLLNERVGLRTPEPQR